MKPPRKFHLPRTPPVELPEDPKSLGELLGFNAGVDLSKQKDVNALKTLINEGSLDTHRHRVNVCFVYLVALCAAAMLVTLVLHYIFPTHVLTPDQAGDLQKFLFFGGVGAAVTKAGAKPPDKAD